MCIGSNHVLAFLFPELTRGPFVHRTGPMAVTGGNAFAMRSTNIKSRTKPEGKTRLRHA